MTGSGTSRQDYHHTVRAEPWSSTDFAYMCLKDEARTLAFRRAIHQVMRPGDVVVDAGAGTGILSLFAIEAGADRVYAVESDEYLCACLAETVRANRCGDKVRVIHGDIRECDLPGEIDVVLAELIETGLVDELQVPVCNSLWSRGIATRWTRFVPSGYATFVELVWMDEHFYDHVVKIPRHEWPFYSTQGWAELVVAERTTKAKVWSGSFNQGELQEEVDEVVSLQATAPGLANALRLSGVVTLAGDMKVGACNAMNGDKILPIQPIECSGETSIGIRYRMGGGLGTLEVSRAVQR